MELKDVTPENYFKKVTYSSDPNPGNKLIVSNGIFVQTAVLLRMTRVLQQLVEKK